MLMPMIGEISAKASFGNCAVRLLAAFPFTARETSATATSAVPTATRKNAQRSCRRCCAYPILSPDTRQGAAQAARWPPTARRRGLPGPPIPLEGRRGRKGGSLPEPLATAAGWRRRVATRRLLSHPPAPSRPGHHLGAGVEPLHGNSPVLGDPIAPTEEQHEVVARPSSTPWRDEFDGEEMPPSARQRGDEVRDAPPHMRAAHGDRVFGPRMAPEPHGHQPAIEQVASVAHRALTVDRR